MGSGQVLEGNRHNWYNDQVEAKQMAQEITPEKLEDFTGST